MKIIVLGCGVIGVTAAYFLNRTGHEVIVIDRQPGAGRETSFANGSLITPSMSDPWNSPESWRVLLASIGNPKSPLKLHLDQVPQMARWGIGFLRNSGTRRFEKNTQKNLHLGLYSVELMRQLRDDTGISYKLSERGAMKIFRSNVALDAAVATAQRLAPEGLKLNQLTTSEAIAEEPALAPIQEEIVGAIRYPGDEVGDAFEFCQRLKSLAEERGVEFRFSQLVTDFETQAGKVTAAIAGGQRHSADAFVIAAGSYSTRLMRQLGIRLPVQPAKGYSITFDEMPAGIRPSVPVIDDELHASVVPLGNAIRIAGTAEFAGFDLSYNAARINYLMTLLNDIFPEAEFDSSKGKPWCGLRAMSVDGVPIIGPTAISNLFINTGHGHLGWTMAAGSAMLLADLVSGKKTAVNADTYSLARFA